jgi:hypothetical protein
MTGTGCPGFQAAALPAAFLRSVGESRRMWEKLSMRNDKIQKYVLKFSEKNIIIKYDRGKTYSRGELCFPQSS